jgi:hypothetical protein
MLSNIKNTLNCVRKINLQRIPYNNLYIIEILGDGSCYFHSILTASRLNYITLSVFDKQKLVKTFRELLADKIGSIYSDGTPYYDTILNGMVKEFAKSVPFYSLENMQKELRSSDFVDHIYQETISNSLNLDIYIININTGDINYPEIDLDLSLLYKNRNSIIIAYHGNYMHYEVIGLESPNDNTTIDTIFPYDHQLINILRDRLLYRNIDIIF